MNTDELKTKIEEAIALLDNANSIIEGIDITGAVAMVSDAMNNLESLKEDL